MKTIISNREAIEQLSGMTYFSYSACEMIIKHYEVTDDEYLFDPTQISEGWHEYTAEEIMEEHGVTPRELCDSVVHFYPVKSDIGRTFLFTFGD
jgi:hypothetical protein